MELSNTRTITFLILTFIRSNRDQRDGEFALTSEGSLPFWLTIEIVDARGSITFPFSIRRLCSNAYDDANVGRKEASLRKNVSVVH